jgi:hypothetical protein
MQMVRSDVSKRPYKSPILIVHGTVKDLTKVIGPHGNSDSGTRRSFTSV